MSEMRKILKTEAISKRVCVKHFGVGGNEGSYQMQKQALRARSVTRSFCECIPNERKLKITQQGGRVNFSGHWVVENKNLL